jgi:hypothetical protein
MNFFLIKILCFSPPDISEHNGNGICDQSNEFHRLPSITSMTVNQIDTTNHERNGSFEDEDTDIDQTDSQYQEQSNQENYMKAYALYDFNGKRKKIFFYSDQNLSSSSVGHGMNGSQYVNAASICVGECVDILEDDHGDGWTRIKKVDGSTGFVPSAYLRIDSHILSKSSHQIESGRF